MASPSTGSARWTQLSRTGTPSHACPSWLPRPHCFPGQYSFSILPACGRTHPEPPLASQPPYEPSPGPLTWLTYGPGSSCAKITVNAIWTSIGREWAYARQSWTPLELLLLLPHPMEPDPPLNVLAACPCPPPATPSLPCTATLNPHSLLVPTPAPLASSSQRLGGEPQGAL